MQPLTLDSSDEVQTTGGISLIATRGQYLNWRPQLPPTGEEKPKSLNPRPAGTFVKSKGFSWTIVWALCGLAISALFPIANSRGMAAFLTALAYLVCLTLASFFVKLTLQSGMPHPHWVTAIHMLITALLTSSFCKPEMNDFAQALPIALLQAATLVLSNSALLYGGVAFVTMLGCSSPALTCALELITGRRELVSHVSVAVGLACLGSMMCARGEHNASLVAFLLAGGSALTRALRVVWQHDLLGQVPPLRLITATCVWCFLFIVPLASLNEGTSIFTEFLFTTWRCKAAFLASTLAAVGLNITGNMALKELGALMQQVVGNLQLIMVLVLATAWLNEQVTSSQWAGVVLLSSGAALLKGGQDGVPKPHDGLEQVKSPEATSLLHSIKLPGLSQVPKAFGSWAGG